MLYIHTYVCHTHTHMLCPYSSKKPNQHFLEVEAIIKKQNPLYSYVGTLSILLVKVQWFCKENRVVEWQSLIFDRYIPSFESLSEKPFSPH